MTDWPPLVHYSADFWLPDHGCYVEVKQFSTERTTRQIADKPVILLQGRAAVDAFRNI